MTELRRRVIEMLLESSFQNRMSVFDLLNSVCCNPRMESGGYKIRRVTSRGTPSYQLGHYEMQGPAGERRSVFKVDVHLGEHQTPEQAVAAWTEDIRRLQAMGRESKAQKLADKLATLQELTQRR
jgi:hypothetical protein